MVSPIFELNLSSLTATQDCWPKLGMEAAWQKSDRLGVNLGVPIN